MIFEPLVHETVEFIVKKLSDNDALTKVNINETADILQSIIENSHPKRLEFSNDNYTNIIFFAELENLAHEIIPITGTGEEMCDFISDVKKEAIKFLNKLKQIEKF